MVSLSSFHTTFWMAGRFEEDDMESSTRGVGERKNRVRFEQDQRVLVRIGLKIPLSQDHDEPLSVGRELGHQAFGGRAIGILRIAKNVSSE